MKAPLSDPFYEKHRNIEFTDDFDYPDYVDLQKKKGSITKLVGFRIPDIFPPAHVK